MLRITRTGNEFLTVLYQIDTDNIPLISPGTTLKGDDLTFTIDGPPTDRILYSGKLSADGKSISGMWKHGKDLPVPVSFVRAIKETAWRIPSSTATAQPKMMAADADPSFSVATIKPVVSGGHSEPRFRAYGMNGLPDAVGHRFNVRASTLAEIIAWAYNVHQTQLIGLPKWAGKERFDIAAVQEGDGMPSHAQWMLMMQKLLTERFHLSFHLDKRELAVYEVTAIRDSDKLVKSLPSNMSGATVKEEAGRISRSWTNSTIGGFIAYALQEFLPDRPVLDRTGLSGSYDFKLEFAPLQGAPDAKSGGVTKANDVPAMDLFTALRKQLGLDLKSKKAVMDILLIDHVESPSEN